jgi:hypothetical protein
MWGLGLGGILVEEEGCKPVVEALDAGVLDVLGHTEQAGLDNERAQTASGLPLAVPEMLGDGATERAAADDDDVEGRPPRVFQALTSLMSLHR